MVGPSLCRRSSKEEGSLGLAAGMGASLCLFAVATFVPGPRQHFAAPRASLLVASAPAEGLKRAAIRTRIERLRRANLLKENEIESLKQQLGQGRRPGAGTPAAP